MDCGISRGYHYVAYKKFDYTLATFVRSTAYTKENVEQIVKNMLEGMIYLHEQEIFNYNINIDVIAIEKINQKYEVKFLDFFMSREKSDRLEKPVVPLSYDFTSNDFTASELLEYRKNNLKSVIDGNATDAFSIFCCIFYVYTLYNPYERNGSSICENILSRDFEIKFQTINYIKIVNEYKKPLLKDLVEKYLSYDAKDRPSLHLALEHPFFWDLKKINAYFDSNFAKIDNPEKYMKEGNFNYKSYGHLPSILLQQESNKKIKRGKGNNNIELTEFLLKNFKSLLYDLWKKENTKAILTNESNMQIDEHDEGVYFSDKTDMLSSPEISTNRKRRSSRLSSSPKENKTYQGYLNDSRQAKLRLGGQPCLLLKSGLKLGARAK